MAYMEVNVGGGGGGMKKTLLWTNPSPSAAFAAQFVSVDLSSYDYVIITLPVEDLTEEITLPVDGNNHVFGVCTVGGTGLARVGTVSTTGVNFTGAVMIGGTTSNNAWCIPQQIYGVKGTIS